MTCYSAEFGRSISNGKHIIKKIQLKFLPLVTCLSRSLKDIGTDIDWSSSYDFLLMFHSNHRPISFCFRDKRQHWLKIANFPFFAYIVPPLKGFHLELGSVAGGRKRVMGLPRQERCWRYLQPWGYNSPHQCDGQTDTGRQQRPRLHIALCCKNGDVDKLSSFIITLLLLQVTRPTQCSVEFRDSSSIIKVKCAILLLLTPGHYLVKIVFDTSAELKHLSSCEVWRSSLKWEPSF